MKLLIKIWNKLVEVILFLAIISIPILLWDLGSQIARIYYLLLHILRILNPPIPI